MNGVSVDDDFARFGAKSYAIKKITSTELREAHPHASGCAILLTLVLALVGLFALFTAVGGNGGGAAATLIFASPVAAAAYWQWKRSGIVEYQLFLMTSAAEEQAYTSRNQSEIVDLRRQIEAAMIRR